MITLDEFHEDLMEPIIKEHDLYVKNSMRKMRKMREEGRYENFIKEIHEICEKYNYDISANSEYSAAWLVLQNEYSGETDLTEPNKEWDIEYRFNGEKWIKHIVRKWDGKSWIKCNEQA